MLPEGQQLGHYRLIYLLNSGGMGEVYLAEDRLLHRQVAIKVIHTDLAYFRDTEAAREGIRLFLREARAIAQLDHPHILPLYDSDEIALKGVPLMYMVMPFRQEGSLAEWLQKHPRRPFSPQEIAYIVQQAADALQHAHEHQIIHQDVKPANFLIRSRHGWRLDLQLADFGVAKLMTRTSQESQTLRGTPAYVAPEQWEGHPLPASDQYALAIMTYELLTGNVPFSGPQHEVMYKHLHVVPKPPAEVNPHLPASIDGVLLRALKKHPAERYPSISAFARAFQRALDDNGAVYQTVVISSKEAQLGTYRTLLLAGRRAVSVDIPPGVVHGEIIKFRGMGEPAYGGQPGSLILTINVKQIEDAATLSHNGVVEKTTPVTVNRSGSSPAPGRRSTSFPAWGVLPLVLFLILGSAGLFYVTQVQAMNTARKNAIATAQSSYSTSVTLAQGVTATISAHSSASAVAQEEATTTSTSTTATIVAHTNLTAIAATETASTTTATAATAAASSATETAATAIARMHLTATATAVVAATVQARATLAATYATTTAAGTLQFADPLQDNGLGYNWDETTTSGGGCAFTNNAYHSSIMQTGIVSPCFARATDYHNFFYQAQMQILKGDQGGLAFCADASSTTFYYFQVSRAGTFALEIYKDGNSIGTLYKGSSNAIKVGLNQSNLLAMRVKDGKIDLYINMQPVATVSDTTLIHGQVGVVAEDISHPTEVAFSNALVRAL